MGTLLLKSRDNDPDRITATLSLHTSPKASVVVVKSDNATLIIIQSEENSDETFVIENVLIQKEPKYSDLNLVISMVMSGIAASLRFNDTTFMIDAFPLFEDDAFEDDAFDKYSFEDYEYSFGNEEYIPRNFAHTQLSIKNSNTNTTLPHSNTAPQTKCSGFNLFFKRRLDIKTTTLYFGRNIMYQKPWTCQRHSSSHMTINDTLNPLFGWRLDNKMIHSLLLLLPLILLSQNMNIQLEL